MFYTRKAIFGKKLKNDKISTRCDRFWVTLSSCWMICDEVGLVGAAAWIIKFTRLSVNNVFPHTSKSSVECVVAYFFGEYLRKTGNIKVISSSLQTTINEVDHFDEIKHSSLTSSYALEGCFSPSSSSFKHIFLICICI